MGVVEVRIRGLSEIQDKLQNLPIKASKQIMRRSLKKAGQPWLDEMKTHVRRGEHRFPGGQRIFDVIFKALTLRVRATSDVKGSVAVGVPKNVFWARFVELGTKLRARGKKVGGRKGRRTGGSTGVMPAFPFASTAFNAKKGQVLDTFIAEVKTELKAVGLLP